MRSPQRRHRRAARAEAAAARRPGRTGLLVTQVLVLTLFATLLVRMWYLQVPMADHFRSLAEASHTQTLIVPATRGQILDAVGRPLVRNRTELVVSADYHALMAQDDGGDAVLRRLAGVLDRPFEELRQRTRLCGPDVPRPCWPGSPYQPISLAEDVDPKVALQIMERREEFPAISAQQQAQREHTRGSAAVQTLGYLSPITAQELEERENLRTQFTGVDQVGRDGLEAAYDEELRGTAGRRRLGVDNMGNVTGVVHESPSQPGMHLVTSLDRRVQDIVEEALARGVKRSRNEGNPADAAAGVVMDVRTGRIVAMASLPTYDPEVWDGGIDQETYDGLLSEKAGEPLISRAVQGQFPPGSTFKVSSLAAAAENGYSLDADYACPSSITVGGRSFQNFEGNAHGTLDLHRAIVVSCNTVFYKLGYDMWRKDGGIKPKGEPEDAMAAMATGFGFGAPTGIDLPHEVPGRIPDREWKREYWEAGREDACARAENGYPEVAKDDPGHADYLKRAAEEFCVDGYAWRAGDAVNFAIGQGDVLVTPLQLARAYAAIANGGTLWEPRVGKGFVSADGKQTREIPPVKAGELPVSDATLDYLRGALTDVPKEGTAQGAFDGFPQDRVSIAGKTGTATLLGRHESAWFASFAPADDPRFAVVVLISQGGTGGAMAAPVARDIYDGIYGFPPKSDGAPPESERGDAPGEADARKPEDEPLAPAIPGGVPPAELPTVRPDGTIVAPEGYAD
ncbi:penicillin-binding protein 2 [Nocardiopsis trehalosi]|jgi:penicillin-binding protein 2|uniref:penicillin-binding protein 2 n=1 Tax=Nocardiopsis trehalosi TaxID=109329 RepID=UPI0008378930|nr:penicillin-binding protein 2 [Nocardiopsis trehalosi]